MKLAQSISITYITVVQNLTYIFAFISYLRVSKLYFISHVDSVDSLSYHIYLKHTLHYERFLFCQVWRPILYCVWQTVKPICNENVLAVPKRYTNNAATKQSYFPSEMFRGSQDEIFRFPCQ